MSKMEVSKESTNKNEMKMILRSPSGDSRDRSGDTPCALHVRVFTTCELHNFIDVIRISSRLRFSYVPFLIIHSRSNLKLNC